MPIFEYQCKSCLRTFEELTFGAALPACPNCHSTQTEKVLSRPCACRSQAATGSYGPSSSGGGGSCSGCSGGSCSSCGH